MLKLYVTLAHIASIAMLLDGNDADLAYCVTLILFAAMHYHDLKKDGKYFSVWPSIKQWSNHQRSK